MDIRQVLVSHKKSALFVAVALVAAVSILGYYAWHKHDTNARQTQQNLNLGTSDTQGMSVAFLARYGYLQGNQQQQKDLVVKYGTASFINSYKPAQAGGSDPVLCSSESLTGVSIIGSQPDNKNILNTLSLKFRDGSSTAVDVEVANQVGGAKINSITCPRSHASSVYPVTPGAPGQPVQQLTQ